MHPGSQHQRLVVGIESEHKVFVQVVEVNSGREIGWGSNLSEQLQGRRDDIRAAIVSGSDTVASSLVSLSSAGGWVLDEVSAGFGITLTAEAGVILSKASAAATFDVTVKFTRTRP
jgi:Trypsin-co-occurring domain 1